MNANKEYHSLLSTDVLRLSIVWGVICFGIFLATTMLVAVTSSYWILIISGVSLFLSGGLFGDAAQCLFRRLERGEKEP